jgi:hypothetical protein
MAEAEGSEMPVLAPAPVNSGWVISLGVIAVLALFAIVQTYRFLNAGPAADTAQGNASEEAYRWSHAQNLANKMQDAARVEAEAPSYPYVYRSAGELPEQSGGEYARALAKRYWRSPNAADPYLEKLVCYEALKAIYFAAMRKAGEPPTEEFDLSAQVALNANGAQTPFSPATAAIILAASQGDRNLLACIGALNTRR